MIFGSVDERDRAARLKAYCDAAGEKQVEWGVDDCSTWPLQWVLNETKKEIDWPVYSSRDEAEAMIAKDGGLPAIWTKMADLLGLEVFDGLQGFPPVAPPAGSVGIIETTYHKQIGVIFAPGMIACARMDAPEDEPGVRFIGLRPKTVVRVWTI